MEAAFSECVLPKAESYLGLKGINKEMGKFKISQQKSLWGSEHTPAHCLGPSGPGRILGRSVTSWQNSAACMASCPLLT